MLHVDLTDRIICSFYNVYNCLGHGFLKKIYESALSIELRKAGLRVAQQQAVEVFYDGQQVGNYLADIVVNNLVIIELKAAQSLKVEHFAQLTCYLKATEMEVGLLLNFGSRPELKRLVLINDKSKA
jgi:GxxExxY protein